MNGGLAALDLRRPLTFWGGVGAHRIQSAEEGCIERWLQSLWVGGLWPYHVAGGAQFLTLKAA